MFAYKFNSFLRLKRPCSGLAGLFGNGHLGPPTAPKRMAEAFLQASKVFEGKGEPFFF